MKKILTAIKIADSTVQKDFELSVPDQCPCCKTALIPLHLESFFNTCDSDIGELFSMYFCPKCEKCFLAYYCISSETHTRIPTGTLIHLIPYGEEKTVFSDNIFCLSPHFVEIFHQAEKAENMGLDEICGAGYRKSLEFLVKDYAIAYNPDKESEIKKLLLSSCISNYINNEHIKALATASAWIGNDETHYVRNHEDYNIRHLKAFIMSIVSFLDSELSYFEAKSLLSSPKK